MEFGGPGFEASLPPPGSEPSASNRTFRATSASFELPSFFSVAATLDAVKSSQYRFSRSEEHTSELQSPYDLVCRLLLEKKIAKKEPCPVVVFTDDMKRASDIADFVGATWKAPDNVQKDLRPWDLGDLAVLRAEEARPEI